MVINPSSNTVSTPSILTINNSTINNPTINVSKISVPTIRVYLGGSFDPVHLGHINILKHVYSALRHPLTPVVASFLPAARSPFKTHTTSTTHRLEMLALNCQHTPFTICDIEINRAPPSYTIDTLRQLRQWYPNDSVIFVLGADNIINLDQWREGLSLTNYCHLWILPRALSTPKWHSVQDVKSDLPATLQPLVTVNIDALKTHASGYIYIEAPFIPHPIDDTLPKTSKPASSITQTDLKPVIAQVSSSQIRQDIANHHWQSVKSALSPQVYQYVRQHNLYQ